MAFQSESGSSGESLKQRKPGQKGRKPRGGTPTPPPSSSSNHHQNSNNPAQIKRRKDDVVPTEESGDIGCICDYDDDDGFMVQCERCFVWQHSICVGISKDNVPDSFFCELCEPRDVDRQSANEAQRRQRLSLLVASASLESKITESEEDESDDAKLSNKMSRDEKKIQRIMQSFNRIDERQKRKPNDDTNTTTTTTTTATSPNSSTHAPKKRKYTKKSQTPTPAATTPILPPQDQPQPEFSVSIPTSISTTSPVLPPLTLPPISTIIPKIKSPSSTPMGKKTWMKQFFEEEEKRLELSASSSASLQSSPTLTPCSSSSSSSIAMYSPPPITLSSPPSSPIITTQLPPTLNNSPSEISSPPVQNNLALKKKRLVLDYQQVDTSSSSSNEDLEPAVASFTVKTKVSLQHYRQSRQVVHEVLSLKPVAEGAELFEPISPTHHHNELLQNQLHNHHLQRNLLGF